MGFTQVDADHIQDDDGYVYYSPSVGMAAPTGPVPSPTSPDVGLPNTDAAFPPAPGISELPSVQDKGIGQDVQPQDPQQALAVMYDKYSPALNNIINPPSPDQVRQAGLVNDLTGFSANGGQIQTGKDLAQAAGGVGLAKEAAQTADINAKYDQAANQAAVDKVKADASLEVAKQYQANSNQIVADAQKRWTDWKTQNDQNMAAVVDPKRAFHNMGGFEKAMWALSFIGAGMSGPGAASQAIGSVNEALNKVVEEDINAQKATIENRSKGLEMGKQAGSELDRVQEKGLASWLEAKNMRLAAVGKQLDIQIAQMGLPAAKAAGLLNIKATVADEVLKNQGKVQEQFNADAQRKQGESFQLYKARLEHTWKLAEQKNESDLRKSEKDEPTLPLNEGGFGLQATLKGTGQPVQGTLRLVDKSKRVEAGQIISSANQEGTLLSEVRNMAAGMSTEEMARGGTPAFQSKVKDLVNAKAIADNGKRVSDPDIDRAAEEMFGIKMGQGVVRSLLSGEMRVGDLKQGLLDNMDNHLRDLSTETTQKLAPYINSEDLQRYDISYNPQSTHMIPPSKEDEGLNTTVARESEGKVAGPDEPPRAAFKTPSVDYTAKQFETEKAAGRGAPGGLPLLSTRKIDGQDEAQIVDNFAKAVEGLSSDHIFNMLEAYKAKTGLSAEAKSELNAEAQQALSDVLPKEKEIEAEGRGLKGLINVTPEMIKAAKAKVGAR